MKIASSKNIFALLMSVAAFSSCGGGGSSTSLLDKINADTEWQAGTFKAQDIFANKCDVPRTGVDPSTGSAYLDKKGTTTDENNFLRSWSNDSYLWYKELPDVNPASYSNVLTYFGLLKTTAKTASGKNKDNFHFTYTSDEWYSLSQAGITSGYGMEFSWIANTPPRNIVVAYTEPGSPAANAGVLRGAKLISVDGYDFINGDTNDIINHLNAALFPSASGETHSFEVRDVGAAASHTVQLVSADVTKTPVQHVKVIDTPSGKVGYFIFNDHIKTAEQELISAVNQLKSQNINDLVLDLRYNGGGALYIASEMAYMIAGNGATSGKTFEKIVMNDKYGADAPTHFGENENGQLAALPSLNLSRVFVITSGDTCSASESIINSLRGVDVEVIQIGSKTCGKPYGFYPQENCGTTYFSIQFKGVNQKGFGEYADGFVPSDVDNGQDNIKGCALGDDLSHDIGDTAELNLATALQYRATASCSLATSLSAVKLQKPTGENYSNVYGSLNKASGLTNRFATRAVK